MKIKKKILVLLTTVLTVSISIPNVFALAGGINTLNESFLNVDLQTEKNDYVNSYEAQINTLQKSTKKMQPIEEQLIVIATLNEYYEEDLKAAELLKKYSDNFSIELVTSIEKEDKIKSMHELKKIFNILTDDNEKDILIDYFEKYAINSGDNSSINFLNENKTYNDSIFIKDSEKFIEKEKILKENKLIDEENYEPFAVSGYNGATAATWAYNNYDQYSTSFPRLTEGGFSDCINFVSQALYKGGMTMQDNWYCYKKNSTYLTPTNTTQLNYSWDLSDPSAWISVKEFYSTWSNYSNVGKRMISYDDYTKNHAGYYDSYYRGDVVIFLTGVWNWVTVPSHAMIISAYDTTNKDFKLAGHSNVRRDLPLLDALENTEYYAGITIFYFN